MWLLRSLGAAGPSLFLLRFPFSFLSIGSNMVIPAVPAAMDVAAVTISIAISMGASLLPSPASPASRSLLSPPLNSGITSLRQASSSSSSLARWLTRQVSHVFCEAFTQTHSAAWILVRTLLQLPRRCYESCSGVNSTLGVECRSPFFDCSRCCLLIVSFSFCQDFCRVVVFLYVERDPPSPASCHASLQPAPGHPRSRIPSYPKSTISKCTSMCTPKCT